MRILVHFRRLVALALAAGATMTAHAQIGKLLPVDEGFRDSSFVFFRARLLEAIEKQDAKYLYSIVDPNIKVSFGASNGLAAFKEQWHPERKDTKLWRTLFRVVAAGGAFREGNFMAPYAYATFPDSLDAFKHGVITGSGVRVRAHPDTTGDPIGTLSSEIVEVASWQAEGLSAGGGWIGVTLKDGRRGYVAEQYIWSPVGYRAIFDKKNGKWAMTALIAGD